MTGEAERVEVDARYLLANERTLLAWQRTALALVAGGVATAQLADEVPARGMLSGALLLAALGVAVTGGVRFGRVDRALRRGELPVTGRAPYAVVVVVALIAVVAAAALVLA